MFSDFILFVIEIFKISDISNNLINIKRWEWCDSGWTSTLISMLLLKRFELLLIILTVLLRQVYIVTLVIV